MTGEPISLNHLKVICCRKFARTQKPPAHSCILIDLDGFAPPVILVSTLAAKFLHQAMEKRNYDDIFTSPGLASS